MAITEYQRLTRRRRTLTGSSDLWLGPDHLLLVARTWWVERYRRFRLAEIQSIVVTERPEMAAVRITALVLTLVVFLAAVLVPVSMAGKILAGISVSLLVIWQTVDLLRGAYCRVVLTTAVTTVRLSAISRMRVGLSFVERLWPVIEAAQQGLGQEPPPLPQVVAVPAESVTLTPETSGATLPAVPPTMRKLPRRNSVPLEWMLFVSALAFAIVVIADVNLKVNAQFKMLVYTMTFAPLVFAAVVAFRPTLVSTLSRPLAWGIGVTSILNGVAYFAAWVQLIQASIRGQFASAEAAERFRPGWLQQSGTGLSVIVIVMALAGMVALLLSRKREPESTIP
jgi:hypothetical protein